MKKIKVIRNWKLAFWDDSTQSFRGWLFATKYDDYEVNALNKALSKAVDWDNSCEVVEFYVAV